MIEREQQQAVINIARKFPEKTVNALVQEINELRALLKPRNKVINDNLTELIKLAEIEYNNLIKGKQNE
tara:strand:- start:2983 stop:3189 length:207 start_codon:yes stop_codon:yes gene_type:complete